MAHLASSLNIRATLFTTNQRPSKEELRVIDAKLEEHALLTLRLAEMEPMIPHLKAIINPVRYIPDDVLSLIFEYSTPWCFADGVEEESFPPLHRTDGLGPPWTLSHVCQNWRAVCLSLPHLWSTLCITRAEVGCPQKIDAIYQRSEPLPLRLCITTMVPTAMIPLVLRAAHRWRCLSTDPRHVGLSQNNEHLFPCLTHLALRVSSTTVYIVAPRLHSLNICSVNVNSGPFMSLPWEQIKRYKSVNTSLEFLQRMKNAEEIVIGEQTFLAEDHQRISLPKMRRLEYNGIQHDDDGLNSFFRKCDPSGFTSLRTLIFSNFEHYEDSNPFDLQVSLPSVIELSLYFFKSSSVRNVLSATPNVQSLHISSDGKGWESLVYCPRHPDWPSVATSLHQLKCLSIALPDSAMLRNVAAMDSAVECLKTYGLPLETMAFYGRYWRGWVTSEKSEGKWLEYVRKGMARSLEMCMENGIQVEYHYDTEHTFP